MLAFLEPFTRLPRNVLIGIAAAVPVLVLLLIVVIIVATRSSATSADGSDPASGAADKTAQGATAKPTRASPERLRAAAAQGIPALEALAAEFPEDPVVHKQLAQSLADGNRLPEMLRTLRTLVKLDKDAVDEKLIDAVVGATLRAETSDEAFAMLEGPLGARGVDALIELSTSKAMPPSIQKRAAKSLARPDVRANASPATSVLLDLKSAKRCEDKRDLLDRVKESGDARLLPSLKTMRSPRGCGFMGMRDCFSCLRKDDSLDEAIKAVEARSSK